MIRILLFTLGVVAAAIGLAWLADRPGTVTVEWLGYQVETSAFVATVTVIAVAVLLMLVWALLRYLWTRPAAVSAYMRERRRQQGFEALSHGLLAIGVGDRAQAQRYAGIAGRNLPREPLTALLRAQAAQLKGDRAAARRAFEAMLDRPETELLGLRGLFLEASRSNDNNAARALVEQAVKRDPRLAWGVNALFDMQARAGDYEAALDTLAIARQNGHIDQTISVRRRAVLLTAEARDLEASHPDKALALASEALRLAPPLVPAAEIAGRILASKGEARQASRVLSRTWKLSPHPDLALVYAYAKPGEAPRDRLKRVKHLASLTPGDVEGPIAVATAAIEAHDWAEARAALAPYLEDRPSARICTLMARIELGEFGDKGREREWLARALRAPRDRAWIADGYVSDRWLPVSPVTGAVDAFEWKAPVDAIGRGDDTLLIEERPEPAVMEEEIAEPPQEPAHVERKDVVVEVVPAKETQAAEEAEPQVRTVAIEPQLKPAIFVPERPPDDPGVGQAESDESPTSLERLRAAQIR
ncbi:MAG TPA: heme biosynthesis HemY N-terminal domain-containing protein [Methyloceanibacter sp.]|nr:heme biosynthesis HemY N-terminal domain-containing protein [Methyloceanibacter sp.]